MLTIERLIILALAAALIWSCWKRQAPNAEGRTPWFLQMEMAELKPNFLLVVFGTIMFFAVSPRLGVELPEQIYLMFFGGIIARLDGLLKPKTPTD